MLHNICKLINDYICAKESFNDLGGPPQLICVCMSWI